jgi:hypothetical protein
MRHYCRYCSDGWRCDVKFFLVILDILYCVHKKNLIFYMSVFVEIEFIIILCDCFSGYIICYRYIILIAIIILCDYFGKLNICINLIIIIIVIILFVKINVSYINLNC